MFRFSASICLLSVLSLAAVSVVCGMPGSPIIHAGILAGSGQQQDDSQKTSKSESVATIRFVSEDTQQLFVIRPAKILASKDYRELTSKAGDDLGRFVNRLNNNYFKFGLAKLEEIDAIVFASWPKTEGRYWPRHDTLILRTAKRHADGFDMATHAVKEEIEFRGETILVVKKPLNRQFEFAWIADEQTIVWGNSQESVAAAISTGERGIESQPWYRFWKSVADDSISFVWVDPQQVLRGVPPQFAPLKKIEMVIGGVKPARKTTAMAIGVCPDDESAHQIVEISPDLLKTAKQALDLQLKDTRAFEKFLVRILIDALERTKVTASGKLVRVESTITFRPGRVGQATQWNVCGFQADRGRQLPAAKRTCLPQFPFGHGKIPLAGDGA